VFNWDQDTEKMTHVAFAVQTTPAKGDYPGNTDIVVKRLLCQGGPCEEGNPVNGIDSNIEYYVTSDNTGTDFWNTDTYPVWSPKQGTDYYFLFMSGMDMDINSDHADTDIYVIKWDGTGRKNLMDDPNYCDMDMNYCGDLFDREDPEDPDSPTILDGDPHWYWDSIAGKYTVVYTRRMKRDGVYISELWTMRLNPDFTIDTDSGITSVKQLTNPCYPDTEHQEYYVSDCTELGHPNPYGDYDPKFSPAGKYIVFSRNIEYMPDLDVYEWDLIVVTNDFDHSDPDYDGTDRTIWNITHNYDYVDPYSTYLWSAEFVAHWKPSSAADPNLQDLDLAYTLQAFRTDITSAMDDLFDVFRQSSLGQVRYKRPIEDPELDPGRYDNYLDSRPTWFPDAHLVTDNYELICFRELGSTTFVMEQAKKVPGR